MSFLFKDSYPARASWPGASLVHVHYDFPLSSQPRPQTPVRRWMCQECWRCWRRGQSYDRELNSHARYIPFHSTMQFWYSPPACIMVSHITYTHTHTHTHSQVSVIEATGLPKEYCHYVFCQYKFWGQDEALIIPPLVQSGVNRLPDGMQRFDHSQVGTINSMISFAKMTKSWQQELWV